MSTRNALAAALRREVASKGTFRCGHPQIEENCMYWDRPFRRVPWSKELKRRPRECKTCRKNEVDPRAHSLYVLMRELMIRDGCWDFRPVRRAVGVTS